MQAVREQHGDPSFVLGTSGAQCGDVVEPPACVGKLLIVDDHALLRVGIRSVLGMLEDIQLEVYEAGTLQDAIDVFRSTPGISLVLLDLHMPDCRGLQGLRQFIESFPQARVAVISGTQDEFVIGQVRALGAVAYITKGQAPQAIGGIVTALLRNGAPEHASLRAAPQAARLPKSFGYDRVAELGKRHLEILDLVLFGCSNQEISSSTGLSLGTIKNYVSTILLALDVKSRSHLISLFR